MSSLRTGFACLVFKVAVAVFFAVFATSCAPSVGTSNTPQNLQGILNGEAIQYRLTDAARSVVLLELLDRRDWIVGYCTGTLIGDHAILTAGHCFDPKLTASVHGVNVVFNANDFYLRDSRVVRTVIAKSVHPEYNSLGAYDHDLSVLIFAGRAPSAARIARLETDNQFDYAGKDVEAYGFGVSKDYSGLPGEDPFQFLGTLRRGVMKIASDYGAGAGIYTLGGETKVRLCRGDSGGPEFSVRNNQTYLVGVNSRADGALLANGMQSCAGDSYATKVSYFSDWITNEKNKLTHKYIH